MYTQDCIRRKPSALRHSDVHLMNHDVQLPDMMCNCTNCTREMLTLGTMMPSFVELALCHEVEHRLKLWSRLILIMIASVFRTRCRGNPGPNLGCEESIYEWVLHRIAMSRGGKVLLRDIAYLRVGPLVVDVDKHRVERL